MLHIDGGEDIDPGIEQLFHILPAFRVAGAGDVGVRQFVHQDHRRMDRQRAVEIKPRHLPPPVVMLFQRQDAQPFQQGSGFTAAVGFHHPGQHINALLTQPLRLFQHGVGFPDTRTGTEENLQFPARALCDLCQ